MTIVKWAALVLLLAATALLVLGQAGWLRGRTPAGLGVRDGRLAPPSLTPNSVSSQASWHPGHRMSAAADIRPLPASGCGEATLARIAAIVETLPGAAIVSRAPDYLQAQFTTRWLCFVDDAEFWHDPSRDVIDVRSASRLGHGDLGVNRARVEAIRARLATAPCPGRP